MVARSTGHRTSSSEGCKIRRSEKKNDLNFFEPAPSLLTDLKRVMLERGCDVDEDPLRVTGARVGGVVVLLPFDVGCDGEPASG